MPRREDHPDQESRATLERFDAALRRWAQRPAPPPPAWPPARKQARPSRAGRRPAPRWQLVAASLALAAALGMGFLLRSRSAFPPPPTPAPATAAVAGLASPGEILVLWLDDETPLYLTLPAAAEAAGTERSTR